VTKTTTQAIRQTENGEFPFSPSPHFVEVEETIFKKLCEISTKENVPLHELTSELFRQMLLIHRKETRELIEHIKKHSLR